MNNTIEKWRAEIDAIDDELLRLLNRRARLAAEIGTVKRRSNAPLSRLGTLNYRRNLVSE